MNIYRFFNFIGEKYPEYKLSADNDKMISNFKRGYKDSVRDDIEDGEKQSFYLEVEGKGHVDEKGKQGLFMSIVGSYETETDPDYGVEYHFGYVRVFSNFKNDEKDGSEKWYTNGEMVEKEYVYDNGQLIKKIYYTFSNPQKISMVQHFKKGSEIPYQNDNYWKLKGIPNTIYQTKTFEDVDNKINNFSSKTKYFTPEGKEVSYQEYDELYRKLQLDIHTPYREEFGKRMNNTDYLAAQILKNHPPR